ncbi:hypothetical protein K461DRAFT_283217 [Myriangium duriaei CBS 260.36]|uniref:Uncharacterized protein n=1 Tax=Myriangium duriaei CBS 260.36 TaxID=1168546 RepID=A0A9P4MBZ6_9PEZI|nr:hypothetical protein K461DRAFT_283217 [Myriangium duriaei CBS 260.36]
MAIDEKKLDSLNLDRQDRRPTPDECIAHLKLLEAISALRKHIGATDGLYGLWDRLAEGKPAAISKMREKRWAIFVTVAARRFERWFQCLPPSPKCTVEQMQHDEYAHIHTSATAIQFSPDTIPPLDVVMVWHSFCLNPRRFLSDCVRLGRVDLWRAGMPWKTIADCIDNSDFSFNPSRTAQEVFTANTDLPWSNQDGPPFVSIRCPRCRMNTLKCHLTTTDSEEYWNEDPSAGANGTGFADSKFNISCTCGTKIDHDLLRTQRFHDDLLMLLQDHVPMPGTLLDLDGLTLPVVTSKTRLDDKKSFYSYPNQLILAGTGAGHITEQDVGDLSTVDQVRKVVEVWVREPTVIRQASRTGHDRRLRIGERIAIRRMMSCYWDNASIFSLDLVGATIRQNVFVQKMHDLGWLHSPAVGNTMEGLLQKYERFFQIMREYPTKVAVPTLDVDLAWHTHQLSPVSYRDYSIHACKVFIDHDDKIDENKLSDSFEWTSKTYEKMFGAVYSECMCWYCQSIRAAHTSSISRFLHTSNNNSVSRHLDELQSTATTDPLQAPHISAHNAIRAKYNSSTTMIQLHTNRKLNQGYKTAVRRAQKDGRPVPNRDTGAYPYWGMMYPVPLYAPYMGDPCINSGMYVADPSCANFSTGAAGNCCSGTCGGGVAAGGCAGGACGGGGSAGGCGGGGGGCGGGGGGCGGGGGGGGGGCGGGGGGGA